MFCGWIHHPLSGVFMQAGSAGEPAPLRAKNTPFEGWGLHKVSGMIRLSTWVMIMNALYRKISHRAISMLPGVAISCSAMVLWLATGLAQGQIESVTRLNIHPSQYGRTDFVVMLTADWTNSPYCANEVRLDLKLSAPSGTQLVVPAFFERGQSGRSSVWAARFTPIEAGQYSGVFTLTNGARSSASPQLSFPVAPSDGKGFLHVADRWALRFDNGEAFRGIGENIAWESRNSDDSRYFRSLNENPRYNYEYLLGTLAASGGNFFRTWMCPWNLPLEWKNVSNTNRYANDDSHFNASAIGRMDQLVDLTESLDLYIMLTLDNSGDFQGWSWRRSSYNLTNGGPVATPQEFFTDPAAKAQFKDRLRYLVARWGYSPHIGAWEFFNEIDNLMYGLPERIPDDVVTAWHAEMSDYLKSIDPYHHLVTTSISHRNVAGLYDVPAIDFNQRHIYGHDGKSQTGTFPDVFRKAARQETKPFVIGEYGYEWDWSRNFDNSADQMDGDFKKGLWLGLFSPTPVLPMSWWWEYFDHRGTTPCLSRVRSVLDQMLAAGNGAFADADCHWNGPATGTLAVRCGDAFFVLLSNGATNPATGSLSLPLDRKQKYRASLYDPEQNSTNVLGRWSGNQPVAGIAVPPSNSVVVMVIPDVPARAARHGHKR